MFYFIVKFNQSPNYSILSYYCYNDTFDVNGTYTISGKKVRANLIINTAGMHSFYIQKKREK